MAKENKSHHGESNLSRKELIKQVDPGVYKYKKRNSTFTQYLVSEFSPFRSRIEEAIALSEMSFLKAVCVESDFCYS